MIDFKQFRSGISEKVNYINEAKVTVADTEVGKFISKNVDKTTKRGGNVNLSIMRQNTIIAHTTDSEGNKHVLNVKTKPDGKFTVGGGMPSMGKPADILGSGKTFSQDKVIEALKAMFELD